MNIPYDLPLNHPQFTLSPFFYEKGSRNLALYGDVHQYLKNDKIKRTWKIRYKCQFPLFLFVCTTPYSIHHNHLFSFYIDLVRFRVWKRWFIYSPFTFILLRVNINFDLNIWTKYEFNPKQSLFERHVYNKQNSCRSGPSLMYPSVKKLTAMPLCN